MSKKYRVKKMLCVLGLGVAMGYSGGIAYGETPIVSPAPIATAEATVDAEGPVGQKITRIDIEGLQSIEKKSIMDVIASRPGGVWTADQSGKDIQAILSTGYFQGARMKYNIVPEGTEVVYEVKENPKFKGLKLTGNTIYKTEELEALATVTPGVVINTNRLTGDLQAVEEHYKKNGYVLARLADIQMLEDGTVTAKVVEGVIEEIQVKGNDKTKDKAILREIRVKKGEPLKAEDARNTIRRLNNLGIFEDVKMDLQPGREPNQFVYAIEVKEGPSRSVGLGGGYNEDDGFSVSAEFGDKNFLGITDQIKLRYEFGGEGDFKNKLRHGFEFSYVHPWLTKKEMSLGLNVYDLMRRRVDRSPDGDKISEYDREARGFDVTLSQPYGEYKKAFVGFGIRDTKYSEHQSGTDYRTVPNYISDNFGRYSNVSLGFIYDDRDNYFVPTQGKRFSLSATQGLPVISGDFNYTQFNLDARKYWPVMFGKAEHTIAVRFLGGLQTGDDVPESDLLSVGGDTVLRGFEGGQFRGTKMLAATLEYRVPVQKYVSVVAFGEVGDAWGGTSNAVFSDPGRSFKLRTTYGLGIRLNTPLGPLRLDYGMGNGEDKGRFSFGFGASF